MQLNDIYIYALKELKGFDEDAIEKAILLAENDIVETVDEFIDFLNFNIEDKKFPKISQPIDVHVIKRAVDKAKKNGGQIVRHVSVNTDGYPQKLLNSQIVPLPALSYKGNLKNLDRKTIMITGSSSPTNNAKLASRYFGELFASKGYNILSSFSEGCEQNSILGCSEVSGISTFFLPHSIEHLSVKERKIIQRELEAGRSTLVSAYNLPKADDNSIEDTYRYLMAICDCIIVPQLSKKDFVWQFVQKCLFAYKPVYLISHKMGNGTEYESESFLKLLGVKYITSHTALEQVKESIGEAD